MRVFPRSVLQRTMQSRELNVLIPTIPFKKHSPLISGPNTIECQLLSPEWLLSSDRNVSGGSI
jgi:hypothetical protein